MGSKAKLKRVVAWCILLMTSAAVLGSQLSYPLFEPDETRNAQLALNIIENNQWMALELNQTHYWDKPPLMAWATAISYKTLGISEATSRLPGVVMMIACVAVVLFAGKRIVGFRAAWMGAMLTLLSCGIPFTGRYLTMDSALTLFVTATLLSVFTGSFDGRFRKAWWIAAGIFTGLGLLSKGPVMLAICLPPVILFSWLTGTPIFNKTRRIAYWAIPCLLVAGPWYIGTMIATPEFLLHFVWKHNVMRFTSAFNHQQPIWSTTVDRNEVPRDAKTGSTPFAHTGTRLSSDCSALAVRVFLTFASEAANLYLPRNSHTVPVVGRDFRYQCLSAFGIGLRFP